MFGVIHPLPPVATVGRDLDTCDVAILHASISSRHAVLRVAGDAITVEDLGSTNGTFIDDERITARTLRAADVRVRFGAVSFAASLDAIGPSPAPMLGRTVPRGDLDRRALVVRGARWELSVAQDAALLAGPAGQIPLSLMEGRLLRALWERGDARFVASAQLVAQVGFGSRSADGDNVRELVRRLRKKLAPFGLDDLVESRRHAGYRLAEHARRA
jgi:hypothetical protein